MFYRNSFDNMIIKPIINYKINTSNPVISKSNNIIEDGNAIIEDKLYKSYKEKTAKTINKINEIGIPSPGEQIRLITMKSFNAIAFIELISSKETIIEMILIIFAINYQAAQKIIELKNNGRIKDIQLIVSSIRNAGYSIKSKSIELLSREKDIKLIFVNSHAKISCLRTKNNFYIIEGSGNFSYNGRIEQYVIDNDEKLFNFTKNWVNEMINSMKYYKDFKIINQ